jgi:hypothetical protein
MDLSTFLENGIVNCHKPSAASEFPPCEKYGQGFAEAMVRCCLQYQTTPINFGSSTAPNFHDT